MFHIGAERVGKTIVNSIETVGLECIETLLHEPGVDTPNLVAEGYFAQVRAAVGYKSDIAHRSAETDAVIAVVVRQAVPAVALAAQFFRTVFVGEAKIEAQTNTIYFVEPKAEWIAQGIVDGSFAGMACAVRTGAKQKGVAAVEAKVEVAAGYMRGAKTQQQFAGEACFQEMPRIASGSPAKGEGEFLVIIGIERKRTVGIIAVSRKSASRAVGQTCVQSVAADQRKRITGTSEADTLHGAGAETECMVARIAERKRKNLGSAQVIQVTVFTGFQAFHVAQTEVAAGPVPQAEWAFKPHQVVVELGCVAPAMDVNAVPVGVNLCRIEQHRLGCVVIATDVPERELGHGLSRRPQQANQ